MARWVDGWEITDVSPDGLFQLLSSVSCGAFVLATDQTVVFWNRRAREILGYAPDRVVGRRCLAIAPEVEGLALTGDCEEGCPMMRSLRAGLVPGRTRIRMRCSSGERKWLAVTPMVVSGVEDAGPLLVYLFGESGEPPVSANIGQLIDLGRGRIGAGSMEGAFETAALGLEDAPGGASPGETPPGGAEAEPALDYENDYPVGVGARPETGDAGYEYPDAGGEPRDPGRPPSGVHLTAREREVLSYLALGWETRYIAEELGVSWYTARNHVENLRRKLGASSRLEAVMAAMRLGLLSSG